MTRISRLSIIGLIALALSLAAITEASASEHRATNIVSIQTDGNDPSSLATAPNGDIWIADWGLDQVQLFSKYAETPASPLKTISLYASGGHPSSSTDASSVAVDSNGFLYVVDASALKIFVFNPTLGTNQFLGDATRTIDLGHRARTIAIDSEGRIYAAGRYNSDLEVRIFTPGTSNGSSTPIRIFIDHGITSTDEPYGLAILPLGEVAVTWWDQSDLRIYSGDAAGIVTPIRVISGSNTHLGNSLGQVVADQLGRLYVYSDETNFYSSIQIFEPAANGNATPAASVGVDSGWGLTLGKNSQIWLGNRLKIVHFDSPFTLQDVVVPNTPTLVDLVATAKAAEDARVAAAKAAEEAHALAVEQAKTEIKSALTSGKALTADQLLQADFVGVTTKNVGLVNSDISKLSEADKTDLKELAKVVLKYATVDKVAEGRAFYSSDLVTVGLIPQDSKIKAMLTSTLKKLPSSSLDSYEKIQAAIASVEKQAGDRKSRLASILAKKR